MNYNLKGTGLALTGEVRSYLDKKLVHTEKFMGTGLPFQLDVELEFIAGAAGPKYRAEYTLARGKEIIRTQAQGSTLHEAIDIASDELSQKIAKMRDKRRHLFRRGAARIKEYLRGFRE